MSWRFPRHLITDGRVLDADDLNQDFQPFAEELGGKLNEHNWQKDSIESISYVQRDAAFLYHWAGRRHVLEGYGPTTFYQLVHFLDGNTLNPDVVDRVHEILPTLDWNVVTDASVSFISAPGLLWVHGSLQLQVEDAEQPFITPGVLVALRINGTVVPETVIGGLEEYNDPRCGLSYGSQPVATSVVWPTPGGQTTVELVVRTLPLETDDDWKGESVYVFGREVFALEMRK